MPPKAKEKFVAAPEVVVVEKRDDNGAKLMELFGESQKNGGSSAMNSIDFAHRRYKEWVHDFGFSMERELLWKEKAATELALRKRSSSRSGTLTGSAASPSNGGTTAATCSSPIAHPSATNSAANPPPAAAAAVAAAAGVTTPRKQGGGGVTLSKDATDPVELASLSVAAGVGLAEATDYSAVDAHALGLGAMGGASLTDIVHAITAPYATATWRLTSAQCSNFKTRGLYRWLCEHVRVVPATSAIQPAAGGIVFAIPAGSGGAAASVGGDGKPAAAGAAAVKGGKGATATAAAATAGQPAPGGITPAGVAGGLAGGAVPDLKSPEVVLAARSGDAEAMAQLFAAMCRAAGLECHVVVGSLKGTLDPLGKPQGFLRWAWNVVRLPMEPDGSLPVVRNPAGTHTLGHLREIEERTARDGAAGVLRSKLTTEQRQDQRAELLRRAVPPPTRQFFVDVALSSVHIGPRAGLTGSSGTSATTGAPASAGAAAGGAAPSAGAASAGQAAATAKGAAPAAAAATASGAPAVVGLLPPAAPVPVIVTKPDFSKHFEPFYFFTDPKRFLPMHYPDDHARQLLEPALGRTAWEIYPRLSHEFFSFRLKTDSHRRRSWFAAKTTPVFVSYLLEDTVHTDVTLLVYRGPAGAINPAVDTPIDSRFIWSTREEREGRVTFSIMVPDVGMYTLLLAARRVVGAVDVDKVPTGSGAFGGFGLGSTGGAPDGDGAPVIAVAPAAGPTAGSAALGGTMSLGKTVALDDGNLNSTVAGGPLVGASSSTWSCGSELAEPYTAAVTLQLLVNFVPTNDPVYPVLHLGPSYCKWLGPVTHKVVAGVSSFAVIPTSNRIRAVAVVNKVTKLVSSFKPMSLDPGALESGSAAKPPTPADGLKRPAPPGAPNKGGGGQSVGAAALLVPANSTPALAAPTVEVSHTVRTLLTLDCDKGMFVGDVSLAIGYVELWVLIDPPPTRRQLVKGAGLPVDVTTVFSKYLMPLSVAATGSAATAAATTGVPPLFGDAAAAGATASATSAAAAPGGSVVSGAAASPVGSSGTAGGSRWEFIPFVSGIQCVKRISSKEAQLNDGRPLVQPHRLPWEADLPFVLRLLSGTTADGRVWERGESLALHSKGLQSVGAYFAKV